MSRIDDLLAVSNSATGEDYKFTGAQVIAAIRGGSTPTRTEMIVSYWTSTSSPTVYFTALRTDGTVLHPRSTTGVSFSNGLWVYTQAVEAAMTEFVAVWDEGDVSDYVSELIVVDT